jgi:hypothetical protein
VGSVLCIIHLFCVSGFGSGLAVPPKPETQHLKPTLSP